MGKNSATNSSWVLIVEDNPFIRKALDNELNSAFPVQVSENYAQAIICLKKPEHLIAVVSDLQMGLGPGGLELLEIVHQRAPSCKRILISGAIPNQEIANAIRNGIIHRFIAKPWKPGEVIMAIRKLIANDYSGVH